MRRWVFLPALVLTVPILVTVKGGDALNVCLNTVAILFLCEIDDITFALGLSERVRARVEDAGRVELADVEAGALARTKATHVLLIVLFVLFAVWARDAQMAMLSFPAFFLGGVAESFVPGATAAETGKRLCKVLLAAVSGFIWWFAMQMYIAL